MQAAPADWGHVRATAPPCCSLAVVTEHADLRLAAEQHLAHVLASKSPGLAAGTALNTLVYALGAKVLLSGACLLLAVVPTPCMLNPHPGMHTCRHVLAVVPTHCRLNRASSGMHTIMLNHAGLTPAGVLHSWVLGTAVFSAFGTGGYVLVCLYFLLGSAVRTSLHAVLLLLQHAHSF